MNTSELTVLLKLDDKLTAGFKKTFDGLNNTTKSFSDRFVVTFGDIAGILKTVGGQMNQFIVAAAEQEDAINRLNSALILQGKYTKALSIEYQDFANSLQRASRFGNEEIMGVMQTLITIGNVAPASMGRATKSVLDFATATGMDLKTASMLVAKGAEGFTNQLSRLGITIDQTLPEAERFEQLLGHIERRMGGRAQSDINSYSGAVAQLTNAWKDLTAEIGKFITQEPLVKKGTGFLTNVAAAFADLLKKTREAQDEINAATAAGRMPFAPVEATAGSGQANQLAAEQAFWSEKANIVIQGNDMIKNIQQQYGDAIKNMTVMDKLFFVQNELERVNLIISTGNLQKNVADQVFAKKQQLLIAEKKLILESTFMYLQAAQTVWGMLSQTMQMAVGENKKYAGVMKAMRIGETIINTATGVARAYADFPWPMSMIVSGIVGALGLAQVGIIAAQPMAKGGIITRPTFAMIGEAGPEAVIPLGKGGAGTVINIEINNPNVSSMADIDTLTEEISRRLNAEIERL